MRRRRPPEEQLPETPTGDVLREWAGFHRRRAATLQQNHHARADVVRAERQASACDEWAALADAGELDGWNATQVRRIGRWPAPADRRQLGWRLPALNVEA